MGYRKLIGFGDSSFVVSLPKDWINKHGLKKGDGLMLDVENDAIKVRPFNTNNINSKEDTEISIEYTEDKQRFKAELIYAYISNFNLINILGKDLHKHMPEIRKVVESLAALEVVQQSSTKVVLKDLLNVSDVAPYDILRRIDRIILSMIEDVNNALSGNIDSCLEALEQKETDVNRLANLVFKVLKRGLDPVDGAKLKLNVDEIFYYWELTLFVEKIGDQLKRIPRHIKSKVDKTVIDAYNALVEQYKAAMRANFTKNIPLALDVIANKGNIFEKLDYCIDKLPRDYVYFLEKMRSMNIYCGNISKVLLKMGMRNQDKK
ncbi:phosphate uptake regulator PhoU [Candidatus Woesearchaeota archaeon]|nr:phosphate uptake regulator PhoU [Candidatus Woesearchaeota archaeon]